MVDGRAAAEAEVVVSNCYDSRLSVGAGSLLSCTLTTSGIDVVGIADG